MKNIFVLESQVYASLSHPKRLEILHLLSHQPLTVSRIVEMTGLSQANVSQHLMVLKKLQLVKVEKRAQQRIYSLFSKHVSDIFESARSLLLSRYGVKELDVLNRSHLHIDPVCHMEVTAKGAAASVTHEYIRYYFCALGCKKRFEKNPQRYIGKNTNSREIHP